jgi:hypothetical protein
MYIPYWPSDRRLSAKLVPTFADRGVSRGQRSEYPKYINKGAKQFSFNIIIFYHSAVSLVLVRKYYYDDQI